MHAYSLSAEGVPRNAIQTLQLGGRGTKTPPGERALLPRRRILNKTLTDFETFIRYTEFIIMWIGVRGRKLNKNPNRKQINKFHPEKISNRITWMVDWIGELGGNASQRKTSLISFSLLCSVSCHRRAAPVKRKSMRVTAIARIFFLGGG